MPGPARRHKSDHVRRSTHTKWRFRAFQFTIAHFMGSARELADMGH